MHKRVLNCLTNKKYKGTPVWFMRQAGRHLPEFKNIRDKNPNFISKKATPKEPEYLPPLAVSLAFWLSLGTRPSNSSSI